MSGVMPGVVVLAAANLTSVAASGKAAASVTHPLVAYAALAALSVLPFVVMLMTSFVKIAVVLAILRSAFGAAQIPPATIITGLALVLTIYVMAPTGERMFRAVEADLAKTPTAELASGAGLAAALAAADKAKEPLRDFLLRHASTKDRQLFHGLALRMRTQAEQAGLTDRDFLVTVPAFLTSELRRAFEIGFLIFIPFLVIDLVIANILMALGMHMLSPTTVSLPLKLLLFVLADGWQLVLGRLVESYV